MSCFQTSLGSTGGEGPTKIKRIYRWLVEIFNNQISMIMSCTSIMWAAAFIYDVAAVKKSHGVPPPRFNLVFQVSALFHHDFYHEWPRFNIVLKCFKPTSFLESPHLVLISFCRRNQHFHKPCLKPHLVFIIANKCSCSCNVVECI